MSVAEVIFTEEYQYMPHERRRFLEKLDHKLAVTFDITLALLIRLVFMIQVIFYIYYLVADSGSYGYMALILAIVAIFADLVLVIIIRKGKEHYWYLIV